MSPKTVLITGCTPGGIGHSLALEFHAAGLRVFATARQTSTIQTLSDAGIETFALEVTSPDSITALKKAIAEATGGKLDYLVNNAGRNYTVPATDIELNEVRLTFETNVFAVMSLCQTFVPLLLTAASTNPSTSSTSSSSASPAIIQIGSLAAVMPYVFGSVYNASKAALHAYTDTLRVELRPFNIRVLNVVTGGVKSNIARTTRTLPSNSIYLPVEAEYTERLTHSQANGVPNEVYAKRVVGHVLGGGKEVVWEGGGSWKVWFVTSYLPKGFMVWVMGRMFKLWKLRGTQGVGKKDD